MRYLFVFSILLICGCDDDGNMGTTPDPNADPCMNIICERGECVEGICECPPGWSGTLCDSILFPTTITLSGLTINMPDPPLSATWDAAGAEQGADMTLTFFVDADFILGYLEVDQADQAVNLVENHEGEWYEDPDFSITLPAAEFYSIGLEDRDGNQYEFMEASYMYFDFDKDEEVPFPTDQTAFGTFNGGNVSFSQVAYTF